MIKSANRIEMRCSGLQAVRFFRLLANGLLALLLTACVSRSPSWQLPSQVVFQGKIYEKVTHNQIDQLQQSLYLAKESDKNPDNWQQGVLFFFDQQQPLPSLSQRLAWREKSYAKQPETHAQLQLVAGELRSEVIYPPTARFDNVQLEVTRGRNLPCGYGQIQFADKRSRFAKKGQNLTAYQPDLMALAAQFARLPWLIACQ